MWTHCLCKQSVESFQPMKPKFQLFFWSGGQTSHNLVFITMVTYEQHIAEPLTLAPLQLSLAEVLLFSLWRAPALPTGAWRKRSLPALPLGLWCFCGCFCGPAPSENLIPPTPPPPPPRQTDVPLSHREQIYPLPLKELFNYLWALLSNKTLRRLIKSEAADWDSQKAHTERKDNACGSTHTITGFTAPYV